MLKNKNIIGIIFITLTCIVLFLIINSNKNKCIQNGGKAVTTNLGIYEKCIYGDNK